VIVKLVLWPMQQKALKSQKALQDLQPKLEELKVKFKDDKEALARAQLELYSKQNVHPLSSCLPLFVQLPVFIALYHSLSKGLSSTGFEKLYSFVHAPGVIEPTLLGLVDLSSPHIVLAFLAGLAQMFQAKMMVTRRQPSNTPGAKDEQMLATMNRQMVYLMPLITVFIGMKLPGGLALYWTVMATLTLVQQMVFFKRGPVEPDATAA